MDEQMDGRTLIGNYVCTEKPGEFKWFPGSLTQVCIGVLLSLLSCGSLFLKINILILFSPW
jgi:hypothetical protein